MNLCFQGKSLLKTGLIAACILSVPRLYSRDLRISLFNELNIRSVVLSAPDGGFEIVADDSLIQRWDSGILYIQRFNNQLHLRDSENPIGNFRTIFIRGTSRATAFRLRPVIPALPDREYPGSLFMTVDLDRLLILNSVETEAYIAGVVRTEGGGGNLLEYYKTQAILCRTYAFSHLGRHAGEGFHLCDGVHCQAYHGRCPPDHIISEATRQSAGLVIADRNSSLITAAYHSNCGGVTASSESVWLIPKPYLQPITDPFCRNTRNARWQRTIPLEDWKNYLVKNGLPAEKASEARYSFTQETRKREYSVSGINLPFARIREDWGLRSAFFNVSVSGDSVILQGRGYGHGIGLCQEGAMQMARQGKNYREIIDFYYKDVSVQQMEIQPVPSEGSQNSFQLPRK